MVCWKRNVRVTHPAPGLVSYPALLVTTSSRRSVDGGDRIRHLALIIGAGRAIGFLAAKFVRHQRQSGRGKTGLQDPTNWDMDQGDSAPIWSQNQSMK